MWRVVHMGEVWAEAETIRPLYPLLRAMPPTAEFEWMDGTGRWQPYLSVGEWRVYVLALRVLWDFRDRPTDAQVDLDYTTEMVDIGPVYDHVGEERSTKKWAKNFKTLIANGRTLRRGLLGPRL